MIESQDSEDESYLTFIKRVAATRQVWGLRLKNTWVTCESAEEEDRVVIPFWSDFAHCERHAVGEWEAYTPTAIVFGDFVNKWLKGMQMDGLYVGPNWDADLNGLEVAADEMAQALMGQFGRRS